MAPTLHQGLPMMVTDSTDEGPRFDIDAAILELRELFDKGKVELPLLSESVQRVIQATSDEATDARSIADLIKRDQAFAGHVLRVSSSPMYAAKSPVVSLQQAVSRLGTKQVREVALMISMQTRVFAVKGFDVELRGLFRHAVATALFAQELARSRRANVEEAFLAGLLHDVGKPIVLQAVLDAASSKARGLRSDKSAVWKIVDVLHAEVGRSLASSWKLPDALAQTIGSHHDSTSSSSSVHVARLADDLAHFTIGDAPVDETFMRAHPMAEELNLYPEDLAALIAKGPAIAEIAGASA